MTVAVFRLPYGSILSAIWQCLDCHMAVPWLPYGSVLSAIWQCLDCHMAVPRMPYGNILTAIWQCLGCHMAVPQMPYGNASNAIRQCLDCHMAVPPLSMAVASLLLAVSYCSCNSYSYCNVPVRVPNTLKFSKLALKLLLLFININYRLLFLLGCHHNLKRHAISFAKNECAFTS